MDLFAALAGSWSGTNRLYLQPDVVAEQSTCTATVHSVLAGHGAVQEYTWAFEGTEHTGVALLTIEDDGLHVAWADTFHTAGTIMALGPDGVEGQPGMLAQGSYPAGEGLPDWGWRIEWTATTDALQVQMWNIPPGEPGVVAVLMELTPTPA